MRSSLFFLLLLCLIACKRQIAKDAAFAQDEIKAQSTQRTAISHQQKQTWAMPGGIFVSNDFDGARVNDVTSVKDTLILSIHPENFPINNSAWYAFKCWSDTIQQRYVKLKYTEGLHRYNPMSTTDGKAWSTVGDLQFKNYKATIDQQELPAECVFSLSIKPDTTWIAAQAMQTVTEENRWFKQLVQQGSVRVHLFGRSVEGRALRALTFGSDDSEQLVLIMSRQHPPEVKGYLAMQSFVHTLLDSQETASSFRKKYFVVVIPTVNPDGVANGHWRHNAAGVDLNRDWEAFNQAETRTIAQFVDSLLTESNRSLSVMIDFHSTWEDVYYLLPDAAERIVLPMIKSSNADLNLIPNINVRPKEEPQVTSMAYFHMRYGAEVLTYEVGDKTSMQDLERKGRMTALALMRCIAP